MDPARTGQRQMAGPHNGICDTTRHPMGDRQTTTTSQPHPDADQRTTSLAGTGDAPRMTALLGKRDPPPLPFSLAPLPASSNRAA